MPVSAAPSAPPALFTIRRTAADSARLSTLSERLGSSLSTVTRLGLSLLDRLTAHALAEGGPEAVEALIAEDRAVIGEQNKRPEIRRKRRARRKVSPRSPLTGSR